MNHPAQNPAEHYWTDGDTATPVFQRPAEYEQLLRLYERTSPRQILEIGTYYGGTLKQWLRRAAAGTVIVAVDTYSPVDRRTDFNDWVLPGCRLHTVQGSSTDPQVIATVRELGPFDWIFIDAGHYYQEVRNDWDNYSPMVAAGGHIILHDILQHPSHPEIEVARLWREITATESNWWTYIEDTTAPWGGIGVVQR